MLIFQCDTGYMPQEEITSTCMSNSSWVPAPECEGIYNIILVKTKLITMASVITVVTVTILFQIIFNFALFYEVIDCGTPHFPARVISEPFNGTKFGASITHHCSLYTDHSSSSHSHTKFLLHVLVIMIYGTDITTIINIIII